MPTGFGSENRFPFDDRGVNVGAEPDDALWDLLSIYIDGEATAEQASRVEEMLRTDPAYAKSYSFLTMASDTVHQTPDVEPPIGMRDVILTRTTHRESRLSRLLAAFEGFRRSLSVSPGMGRFLVPAGSFAAAALVGVLVWSNHTSTPHTANPTHDENSIQRTTAPSSNDVTGNSVVTNNAGSGAAKTIRGTVIGRHEDKIRVANNEPKRSVELHPGADHRGIVTAAPVQHPSLVHYTRPGARRKSPLPMLAANTPSMQPDVQVYQRQMDDAHKHPSLAENSDGNTDLGPAVDSTDDVATTSKAPDSDAVTQPTSKVPAGLVVSNTKPIVHYAALPPEARQIIDGATLKRNKEAQWGGYDRDTVESIQRHEVTLSVIKSTF